MIMACGHNERYKYDSPIGTPCAMCKIGQLQDKLRSLDIESHSLSCKLASLDNNEYHADVRAVLAALIPMPDVFVGEETPEQRVERRVKRAIDYAAALRAKRFGL